jgi:hypothetical protein
MAFKTLGRLNVMVAISSSLVKRMFLYPMYALLFSQFRARPACLTNAGENAP